jgi:hypothetical protein
VYADVISYYLQFNVDSWKCLHVIFLVGKTIKNFSQNNRCPDRDSNKHLRITIVECYCYTNLVEFTYYRKN